MRTALGKFMISLFPSSGAWALRGRRVARRWTDRFRSPESVFTRIYQQNLWGGAPDAICSGGGSHDVTVADAYCEMVSSQAELNHFRELAFVDLGCGDMHIGMRLIPLCRKFIGVDVVRFVVDRHRAALGSERVEFFHKDIVADELPEGDVCFIRQVFQHLSNRQIAAVIEKLGKYRWVYVTEHVPSDPGWRANSDKPHGAGIRLDVGSGVDLTAPPFGLPPERVRVVMETPGNHSGGHHDPGVIRTVVYTPIGNPSVNMGKEAL